MAQQVVIAGAMFEDVPQISVPDANNVYHPFLDTTIASNAAAASDITQGKLAYVNGSLVTGTNQGGGGGVIYETGTFTPSADVAHPSISFQNAHATMPYAVSIVDSGNSVASANSNINWLILNYYAAFGSNCAWISSTEQRLAVVRFDYRTSSGTSSGGLNIVSLSGSTNTCLSYWLTESAFIPYSNASSRYFRSGRTYKWVAVWAPTS